MGLTALWALAALPLSAQIGLPSPELAPRVDRVEIERGGTLRVLLTVEIPGDLKVQANKPADPSLIPTVLTFDDVAQVEATEVVFPEPTTTKVLGFDEPLLVYRGQFPIGATLEVADDAPLGPTTLRAEFRYQACDETTCYFPQTLDTSWTFDVVENPSAGHQVPDAFDQVAFGTGEPPPVRALAELTATPVTPGSNTDALALFDQFDILTPQAGSYMDEQEFLEFVDNAENGVVPEGLFDNRGPLAILALVFIGGLALNLTPCVLPMIPINLMIIGAGAHGGGRGRGFLLGMAYGTAMALVYGVIGLVVILTAGTFGTINASPWFNGGIAVLFVVLGLAMFDVFAIDFSRFSSRIQFSERSRGTFMLAFGMGTVAAVLAGACVAPVVIQVVIFASERYAAGTQAALALPFVLGLGMALPWPLAGAGFTALPRPGPWMVRVKQAMGVFILGTAVYYGYVAYGIVSARWVDPASVQASVEEMLEAGWQPSLAEGLQTAQRDDTLVLVDFWATWCKNCLVMDETTLSSDAVEARLQDYTKIKYQAENLDVAPTRELMDRINAVGLPAYVILRPR